MAIGVVCDDPRQFVPASGQQWTSLSVLGQSKHHSILKDTEDTRVSFIQTEPSFGINQTRMSALSKLIMRVG